MVKHARFNNRPDVDRYRAMVDRAFGLPIRGHALDGSPKGPDTPGYGWSIYQEPLKTKAGKYSHRAIDIDSECDASVLSPEERDEMRAVYVAASELDDGWQAVLDDVQGEDEQ